MFTVVSVKDFTKGTREVEVEIQDGYNPGFEEDIWYTLRYMGVNYFCKLSDPVLGPRDQKISTTNPPEKIKHHDPVPKNAPVPGQTNPPGPSTSPGPTPSPPSTTAPPPPANKPEPEKKGNEAEQVKARDEQIKQDLDNQKEAKRQENRAAFQAEVNDFNSQKEQKMKSEGPDEGGGVATVKKRITPRATHTGVAGVITAAPVPAGTQIMDENVNVILQLADPLNDFLKKGVSMKLTPRD